MKNIFLLIAIISITNIENLNAQKTISGVTLPAKIKHEKNILLLNGGGIREKYWIDLYVAGLFVVEKSKDANKLINADEKMSIRLTIISSMITSKKMSDAVEEGFENSTNKNTTSLRKSIDIFKAVFMKNEIKKGDVFDIVYIPGTGTVIYTNNKIAATIKGLSFKKALFGIWLGNKPADDDLKEGLLGN